MATQGTFDWETGKEISLDARFAAFHASHPEVFVEFCRLARQLREKGYRRYSAKGLFEVLRFRTAIDGRPGDEWKLNNNYSSRYSRMLLERDTSFVGFFETRVLKTAEKE